MVSENMTEVINGISNSVDDSYFVLYKELSHNQMMIDARCALDNGDTEAFYVAINYPINKFMENFIESKSSNKYEIFLYRHSTFIESGFAKAIQEIEGPMCVNEKSKTIMLGLAKHFKCSQKIEFDRSQPFTYHLPTTIFCHHDGIMDFFIALYEFYNGAPEKYLSFFDTSISDLLSSNSFLSANYSY